MDAPRTRSETMTKQTRDPQFPEWTKVYTDSGVYLGEFGRVEELGVIEWVAFGPKSERLGAFRGRGSRGKAYRAVLDGSTEVERLFAPSQA
jgi:hypothetical protein